MKIHNMKLKQPYFDLVNSGLKTVELRLYDDKRQQVAPGDTIIFQNGESFTKVRVKGLVRAENFGSLLDIVDVKCTGLDTKENAVNIMKQFFDEEAQSKFGVIGIVIDKNDN